MPFKRFVECGRVVFITDGPYAGKTCCIVDCIDQKSVLVDGPETGVPRQKLRLSQMHLTKFRIKYPFTAPTRIIRAAWKQAEISEKWAISRWAQKAANKKRRSELTDYERFKLKRARTTRNKIRTEEYKKLLKRVYNPVKKANQTAGKKKVAKKPAPKK